MFDQKAFFECLGQCHMSVSALAKALDISRVTLYRKISGESDFVRREIQKCRELFGVEWSDRIFFAPEVA